MNNLLRENVLDAANDMSKIARTIAVSLGPTVDKKLLQKREIFYIVVAKLERAVDAFNKENK